jgi:hypothetical protein
MSYQRLKEIADYFGIHSTQVSKAKKNVEENGYFKTYFPLPFLFAQWWAVRSATKGAL